MFKFKKWKGGNKNGIINLMQNAFCLAQSPYCSGPNLSSIRGVPCAGLRMMMLPLPLLPPPLPLPWPSEPGAELLMTSAGTSWPAGAPWCGCHPADSFPGSLLLMVARWRPESLLRLGAPWAPEMCRVAVTVGRPIGVGHLDSSCLTEEPVCSCACLPAEVKGPSAAAEATAAAAGLQRLQLQLTQWAAEQAAAVWRETVGRGAAGGGTAGSLCANRTGSSGSPEGSARADCTWQPWRSRATWSLPAAAAGSVGWSRKNSGCHGKHWVRGTSPALRQRQQPAACGQRRHWL